MKGRHQTDFIWRFQVADHQMKGMPSSLEVLRKHWLLNGASSSVGQGVSVTELQITARERSERIDRVLSRLPHKPVSLARVLYVRYGPEEHRLALREVLPNIAAVAAMTNAAKLAFERAVGEPPRPRLNDVLLWLEGVCHRVMLREHELADKAALADILHEADLLLAEAETTYEKWAERQAAA